jgi:hypothetical protein
MRYVGGKTGSEERFLSEVLLLIAANHNSTIALYPSIVLRDIFICDLVLDWLQSGSEV